MGLGTMTMKSWCECHDDEVMITSASTGPASDVKNTKGIDDETRKNAEKCANLLNFGGFWRF